MNTAEKQARKMADEVLIEWLNTHSDSQILVEIIAKEFSTLLEFAGEKEKEIYKLQCALIDKYPDARALEFWHQTNADNLALRTERLALQSRLRTAEEVAAKQGEEIKALIEQAIPILEHDRRCKDECKCSPRLLIASLSTFLARLKEKK